jgi:hypothetical protein
MTFPVGRWFPHTAREGSTSLNEALPAGRVDERPRGRYLSRTDSPGEWWSIVAGAASRHLQSAMPIGGRRFLVSAGRGV